MPVRDFRTDALAELADPEAAALFLKAAYEEALTDNDFAGFMLALSDVIEARGSVQTAAAKADISRQHLHSLLSAKNTNPTLSTLSAVLKAAGLMLDFRPVASGK